MREMSLVRRASRDCISRHRGTISSRGIISRAIKHIRDKGRSGIRLEEHQRYRGRSFDESAKHGVTSMGEYLA